MRKLVRFFRGNDQTCSRTAPSTVSISTRTVFTVFMFVTLGLGQAFAQEDDCMPSFNITCPPAATVACADIDNESATGLPTVEGNTCDAVVTIEKSDVIITDGACSKTIMRVWTASVGDYVSSCSQMISSFDNVGPVFNSVPPAQAIQCSDELPAQSILTATDACGSVAEVVSFSSSTSVGDDSFAGTRTRCTLTTPIGPGPDGSIWLNNVFNQGLAASNYWSWTGSPSLEEYPDGTAHLVGTVQNNSNGNQQWQVDMWFEGRKNWNQWSALGRLYKDDLGFGILNNNFLAWSYYELVPTFSTLTGAGSYAGNILYLSHQPANYLFGFQKGVGANSRNGNDGMSGWFFWEGWYNGEWRSGNGDMFTNNTCANLDEPCVETTTYVWRAQDACGNNSFASQIITVEDTTDPIFDNCPVSVVLECGIDSIPAVAAPTATDNCTDIVTVTYLGETSSSDGPCFTLITRTWVAEDECQNRAVCTQTITIQDTTDPTFDSVPANIIVECSDEIVRDGAIALDACDSEVTITVTETEVIGQCPQERVISRVFVATDECQNSVEHTQTITVIDTTAPTFDEFDVYVSADCGALDEVPAPTATDLCGEVTVELTNELLNSGGCLGVLERTYTATDACGNSSTAILYISILDTTPPTIDNPADMMVECDAVPALPSIEIYDNCENEVTFTTDVVEIAGECENSYTILWIWTATDLCENVSVDTTVVTVQDTTNPTFDIIFEDETYSCEETLPEVVLPLASDNCDEEVTVSYTDLRIDGDCPQEYQIERMFRAFDNCGNSTMFVQNIYVQDNEAPIFDEQSTFYLYECSESIPTITPSVDDVCSEFELSFADSVAIESDCFGFTYRTWTAVDACGNSSQFVQTFQIQDTTAPVITANFEEELPCDNYDVVLATATDNCDENVTLTYADVIVSGGACQGRIIRTYTATDDCGNTATAEQFITLLDVIAPELEEATADATFECGVDEYSVPTATFSDNCDEEVTVTMEMTSSFDGCLTTIVYTFIAEDNCENTTEHSVTYTIEDTTAPVVTVPSGGQFSCSAEVVYGEGSVSDECDMDVSVVVSNDTVPGLCIGSYQIIRTWTATDNCGNVGVGTANYYIFDNEAPEFDEVPADITIECDQAWPTALPIVSDVCGTASVTESSEVIQGNCLNYYTVIRTFTATDDCGNVSTEEQMVTVIDTTAPVITANFEEELPCDNYDVVLATATDNCDENVTLTYSDIIVSGGACQGRIIRTYSATDDCGNTATAEQFITLLDAIAPELEEATADATYECGVDEYSVPTATFSDNCDDELSVSMEMASSTDGCLTTITYTFTAEDNCENTATHTVTYTIEDTTAPVVTTPAGGEFSCDEEIMYGEGSVSDECDMDVSVVVSNDTVPGLCIGSYQIIRTWTATDNCGNVGVGTANYYIFDNEAPEFYEVPADITIECDQAWPTALPIVSDVCGTASVTESSEVIQGNCLNYYTVIRTFTATDDCGNVSTEEQMVTVIDTTAPVITLIAEEELPCDSYDVVLATATDNCDENVTLTYSDIIVSGGACQGRIIRTYSATDDCGNTATAEQFITLLDAIAPELEEATADATYECGIDEYPVPTATFSDNCDDEVTVTMEMTSSFDGCLTTIVYTFIAEDNCENTTEHSVTYTIEDTTPPSVFQPAGGEFSCDSPIAYGEATAFDLCDTDLVIVTSNDTIPGSCPNNYMIQRMWTATDNCGNSSTSVTTYFVVDNTIPTFDNELSNEFVDCFPVDYQAAVVTASDNCGTASVVSTLSTDIDDCGNGVIVVSYVATDLCGNQAFDSYTVTINDDVAPVLNQTPADIELECGDEIPVAPVVTASDNCDSEIAVQYTETILGENPLEEGQVANCEILTPQLPENDPCNYEVAAYNNSWAMALFSMPNLHKYYHIVSGNFVQFEDGTIHVIAQVENNNPAFAGSGFNVDVNFGAGLNWADWSTQSFMTGFKADCGGVAANRFDWSYFLLVPGAQTELVGYGAYAGSSLNLVHAPANNYFGFQLGSGANNYNDAENGFGGWFTYSGTFMVNGNQVMSGNASGAGDFAFELDCCPDYTIERCWSAVDCSGNDVSYCQTIIIGGGAEEAMPVSPFAPETATAQKGSLEIVNIFPNPATERAQVKFVSETQNTVVLDIVDLTGRKVAQIYNGQVDAGVVYNFDVNTREFGNGLYQVRLMSLSEVEMKQLSIVK